MKSGQSAAIAIKIWGRRRIHRKFGRGQQR
jgi:hypothetical protein